MHNDSAIGMLRLLLNFDSLICTMPLIKSTSHNFNPVASELLKPHAYIIRNNSGIAICLKGETGEYLRASSSLNIEASCLCEKIYALKSYFCLGIYNVGNTYASISFLFINIANCLTVFIRFLILLGVFSA